MDQHLRQVDADQRHTSTSQEVDEAPPTKRRADKDHLAFKRHALRRTSDYEPYYEEDWASEEEADQDDNRVHEVHEEVRDSPKLTGGNSGGTPASVQPRFSGQGDQPMEHRSTGVTRKTPISSIHSGHPSDVEVVIPDATLSFYRETTKKDDKTKENRQDSQREEEIQRIVEATLNRKAKDEAERRQETSLGSFRSHPQDEPKDKPQTSKTPVVNSEHSITQAEKMAYESLMAGMMARETNKQSQQKTKDSQVKLQSETHCTKCPVLHNEQSPPEN